MRNPLARALSERLGESYQTIVKRVRSTAKAFKGSVPENEQELPYRAVMAPNNKVVEVYRSKNRSGR